MGFSCVCDDDSPEVFESKAVRARKEHTCCECGEAIRPGETYERYKGKWGGRI